VLAAGAPSESETSVIAEDSISTLWSLPFKLEEVDGEKDMVRSSYWKLETAMACDRFWKVRKDTFETRRHHVRSGDSVGRRKKTNQSKPRNIAAGIFLVG
jgi:hypothetical protein